MKLRHLPFLDGIRGFSSVWVLLGHSHLFSLGWQRSGSWWGRPLDALLYMHLGVNVFLALSGFCLALPVINNASRLHMRTWDYFLARVAHSASVSDDAIIDFAGQFLRAAGGMGTSRSGPDLYDTGTGAVVEHNPASRRVSLFQCHQRTILEYCRRMASVFCVSFADSCIAPLWAGCTVCGRRSYRHCSDLGRPRSSAIVGHDPSNRTESALLYRLVRDGNDSGIARVDPRFQDVRMRLYRYAKLPALALCILLCALLWKYRIIDGNNVHVFFDHAYLTDRLAGAATAAMLLALCGLQPEHTLRRFFECRLLVAIGGFSYSLYLVHVQILALLNKWIEDEGLAAHSAANAFFVMVFVETPACLLFACAFADLFEQHYRPAGSRSDHQAVPERESA